MDAATAIVGAVSEFGAQWVTAPQECAGGGVCLEDARGWWWWACSAVGGRWCRGLVLRVERVSARQQAFFGVERRETRRGERVRSAVQQEQGERLLVGFIREAGRSDVGA